jgi:protein-tyrosine phosphatase
MVDIHHHLLYGLDDGSTSLETSVEMARLAVADGITHVVCTPHSSYSYPFSPERVAETMATLRTALAEASIPLTLGNGCDFHLSFDNVETARDQTHRFSINHGRYLLIELPDQNIPTSVAEISYELQLLGLIPILTHPERNPILQREPDRVGEWVAAGMLVQITADSLTGHKGRHAQKAAELLLGRRWIHFLASDAHNTSSRPPRMQQGRNVVARRYGSDYADLLTVGNPRAVFDDQPLPTQPELPEIELAEEKPGLWRRLFGQK